jgi:hypothetical protein
MVSDVAVWNTWRSLYINILELIINTL